MKRRNELIFLLSAGLTLLLFPVIFGASVSAQPGNNIGSPSSPTGPFSASIERRLREIALRGVTATGGMSKRDVRAQRAALDRLNADFKQIQLIRLGMIRDIEAGRLFEYKRLSYDAGEIRKRVVRLKGSLELFGAPERASPPEKVEFNKEKIQDATSDLCLEISRFIENRIFKTGAVYNARDVTEAGRTLDTIINLSANIKNSAEKLKRSRQ